MKRKDKDQAGETSDRPLSCNHSLYPICGCTWAPPLASNLIVKRDREAKAEAARVAAIPKRRGPKKVPWAHEVRVNPKEDFLNRLPTMLDDPYTRAALLKVVNAELAKANFAEYCRQAWHVVEPSTELEWSWHHELICKVLQGILEDWMRKQDDKKFVQRIRNAIFSVPPGSLKSKLCAVFLPTWMWLRRPGWKVICLSVNEDAAMRDARDSRSLIKSEWYQSTFQPDWQLNKDQDAISNYANSKGGIRLSRASGAEIVGLRGDCLIVDDANNPKEAESKVIRESVNELYNTNIHNRVNHPDQSVRIGIQQRTHAEDWTGYLVKRDGVWTEEDPNPYKWLHVVIPAEFEPERRAVTPWGSDPRTIKGESLHPVRMDRTFLDAEKVRFGSQKYAGQMQQRPTLAEGGMVKMKWWRFFHYTGQTPVAPGDRKGEEIDRMHVSREVARTHGYVSKWDFDWTVISLDPAAKATERGSQHGILVLAGKGPQRFVLEDKTCRGDVLDVIKTMERLCAQYDPDRIIIEAKAAGPTLMTLFEEKFQRGNIKGSNGKTLSVIVDSIEPQGGKATRLDACLPELEAGLVHLLDGADWLEPFVGEVCGYPLATYDDRPDALSQGLNHMRSWGSYELPSW